MVVAVSVPLGAQQEENPIVLEYQAKRGDHQALAALRLAAEEGDADAQVSLGRLYAGGEGVPQDFAEVVRLYRLAAEQGRTSVQRDLGDMYYNGRGVPVDYAGAAQWYRLAAERNDTVAQFNLALMYIDGLGVPRDLVQAHMWFNLAARFQSGSRGDAGTHRAQIENRLSPAQLVEAQRLAREWDEAHPRD